MSLLLIPARGHALSDQWFFGKDAFNTSFQLDLRSLSHIGTSTQILGPTGGYFLQLSVGAWWWHLLEGSVHGNYSISGTPFYGAGAALKLNFLEFSKANVLEFAGNHVGGLYCVETRRGLATALLRSLLLHLDGAIDQNWFNVDAGQSYSPSQLSVSWGAGAQWGPNLFIPGIDRYYIETEVHFARVAGTLYALPAAGLGFNF